MYLVFLDEAKDTNLGANPALTQNEHNGLEIIKRKPVPTV